MKILVYFDIFAKDIFLGDRFATESQNIHLLVNIDRGKENLNLDWCWDGNPYIWLGSASCVKRVS